MVPLPCWWCCMFGYPGMKVLFKWIVKTNDILLIYGKLHVLFNEFLLYY